MHHLYTHLFRYRHIVTELIKSAVHSDNNYLSHSTDELHSYYTWWRHKILFPWNLFDNYHFEKCGIYDHRNYTSWQVQPAGVLSQLFSGGTSTLTWHLSEHRQAGIAESKSVWLRLSNWDSIHDAERHFYYCRLLQLGIRSQQLSIHSVPGILPQSGEVSSEVKKAYIFPSTSLIHSVCTGTFFCVVNIA